MINIAIIGATGKMGMQIATLIAANPQSYNLSVAIINKPLESNHELNHIAKVISTDFTLIKDINVVIDFSTPEVSMEIAEHCSVNSIPLIIGTTGFSATERLRIEQIATEIPLLISPNMSLSVNMLFKLAAVAAKKLAGYEAEITEAHHRYKKDAPSGTAMKLGEAVATARGIDFNKHAVFTRHGRDEVRHPDDIGFAVVRGGDIVGKHEVALISDGEVLTLGSEISNRRSFAQGSLVAAAFLAHKSKGLYTMFDVLDL